MAEYIEREALLADFGEPPMVWTDSEEEIQARLDWYVYKGIVESQPAADVVEVRRGRWIDAYGDVVGMVNGVPWSDCSCSVCRSRLTGSGEYDAKGNYCPNCGARMDGE